MDGPEVRGTPIEIGANYRQAPKRRKQPAAQLATSGSPLFAPITSADRLDKVKSGAIDLECGSTTNNLQRQKELAFSPVFSSPAPS
jgi:hypothetical protein